MTRLGPGPTRRTLGLIRKEAMQILRDPSSYLIAGALPLILLVIFGYGVSLDLREVAVGVVVEQPTPETDSLLAAFRNSRYFVVTVARHRREVDDDLVSGRLKGLVVIPADFSARLARSDRSPIQVIVDGSDPNTAGLVQYYTQGVISRWLQQEAVAQARSTGRPPVMAEPRYWFNPEVSSKDYLLPGAVAVIMTLIGTLLTALVVAREWERGTMEAVLATQVSPAEFLAGKIVPYFVLGMLAMVLSTAVAVFVFGVPFRGSVWALLVVSSAFLATMLALGLLISTVTRNQFAASQAALVAGFLPAFELSGFIFEIDSMPTPIRLLTYALPPRYYVSSLQTIFLAGDIPEVLVPNTLVLTGFAAVLFTALVRATRNRLE